MPVEKKSCITAQNLSYQIGDSVILDNLSFTIHEGDYVGLLGPNGGGKTTLIKLILSLLKPTSGMLSVCEKSIGYVPQKIAQSSIGFPTTVDEVVKSGRTVQRGWLKRSTQKDADAIERAMKVAGVKVHRHKLIAELSGGERQRVFIARALAAEPCILILDEPTTGVDFHHQEVFYGFLRKLHQNLNLTIIYVTHDIDFISNEVDTVLCLNQSLVCHLSPEDFFTKENLEKVYGPHGKIIRHHH